MQMHRTWFLYFILLTPVTPTWPLTPNWSSRSQVHVYGLVILTKFGQNQIKPVWDIMLTEEESETHAI